MMNSQNDHAERLSAFIDGELAADEIDALLEALENPACRDQLGRYAGYVSRQSSGGSRNVGAAATRCDISGAVSAAIRAERNAGHSTKVVSITNRRWSTLRNRRFVAFGGLAVAASVAALTISIAPMISAGPGGVVPPEMAASPSVALAAPQVASAAIEQGVPVQAVALTLAEPPASERRELVIPVPRENIELNQLYLQHARFRGGYALAAPVSYGRVGVATSAVEQESR